MEGLFQVGKHGRIPSTSHPSSCQAEVLPLNNEVQPWHRAQNVQPGSCLALRPAWLLRSPPVEGLSVPRMRGRT